ncbi:hypothetical protein DW655_12925 [Lachnospiraceae bacterium AM23-2LB]|uniref:TraX family protein n=1 Tax=Mediterraneibacter glycyrrhizinilyticus TaxID=342942 RepID=UPI0009F91253|nr:hypothetical protein [Lachnospiraceae bacterium 210521-DFI.1.109]MCB6427987.1 hypothetical protein [Mediterraneibacter glycyrrhizinilyticus]RGC71278.1 hypothetical protein DW655_12925 [Lachnospiraceae bacterium AM23-2LB]RJW02180.1 hypothetical protein DW887_10095 [Lachnospiraceae bacterium AM40-2BH]
MVRDYYLYTFLPACAEWTHGRSACTETRGHAIGFEIFALLALPVIYIHTKSNLKISKWFFYIYYPAHLFAIFLIQLFI